MRRLAASAAILTVLPTLSACATPVEPGPPDGAGDGDYLMTGQEIATAVQYGINAVVVVVDNGTYGTIRMHQETHYPGGARTIATDLRNPDFVAYAEAFGAFGVRCERTEDFPAALEAARNAGRPALVHLLTSAEDIAPGRTISGLRQK